MAAYTTSEKLFTRVVFELKTPTNWTEVSKVIAACNEYLIEAKGDFFIYDDTVMVVAEDDCIRFVIEIEGKL